MTPAERILLADDMPRRAEDWNDWGGMVDRMRRAIGARHDGHPKRPAPRRALHCLETNLCFGCPDDEHRRTGPEFEQQPRRAALDWEAAS